MQRPLRRRHPSQADNEVRWGCLASSHREHRHTGHRRDTGSVVAFLVGHRRQGLFIPAGGHVAHLGIHHIAGHRSHVLGRIAVGVYADSTRCPGPNQELEGHGEQSH